ncbi:MAG: Chaperone protein DnaK [Parcubacteria group bacterium GW2011_GWA2_51_12]|nr:MAG: Chaperone protein DnaK [Parcubacteria group bacterium GW2011_GWA2_51_12]
MSKIIGIDLGTSNSAAAILEGGKPSIIPSAEGTTVGGGKAFPSYVAMSREGELLVGEPARRQSVTNPEGTVYAVKRKMGTKDKIKMRDKEYTPEQISAFILQKIKRDAEAYLGEPVQKAVGLDKAGKEQKILVFDFGGGTLDVTIMDFGQGVFEVISTSGDTHLGGTDMDNVVMEFIAGEFKKDSGIDIRGDKIAFNRLKEAAEKAKIELSTTLETEINLPFISADASGPKHLQLKMTRAKLEELVKPIVDRTRQSLEQAISDAKLAPKDIDRTIMVGGPTRMPLVQKFVEGYLGKQTERGVDPMEAVAKGAAVQAGVLGGEVKDVLLLDVTPLTLGIETLGGVSTPLIERNTTIPTAKSQVFSTAADSQTSVEIHILQGDFDRYCQR